MKEISSRFWYADVYLQYIQWKKDSYPEFMKNFYESIKNDK